MALRIGGLPVLIGPSDVLAGARSVLGWTDDTVRLVVGLPERVSTLLRDLELLLQRVTRLVDSVDEVLAAAATSVIGVEAVLARAGGITDGAAAIVVEAGGVTRSASGVVDRATAVTQRAQLVVGHASGAADSAAALLAVYEPIAERAAPLARRFVDEFSEEELSAAIRMVDQLPQLAEHLETDIMPILAKLDGVGPDITELLGVVKDVRQAIQAIPGFRLLRRRGEAAENGR